LPDRRDVGRLPSGFFGIGIGRPSAGKNALSSREEDAVPEPGSNAYDKQRAELRKEFEDQGLSDKAANERANEVLQGERPEGTQEPRSRREPGTGHAGRGRGSG
jgi:hypothetical protein